MPRHRSLQRSRPVAGRSRYSHPAWRRPGTVRQPRCSTPSCALEYRRPRRFAPVADLASAGRAGVVKLRWFVERTCGDLAQDRRHACGRKTPRYTDWPTLSRLRIPAHWLVLRSTVEEISDRNVSRAWLPPSEHVAFVLRGTRADALHAEVLAVGGASRGRPSNRERSRLADHTFRARRPPVARAGGADEPDWCDARPFARRHRSVSGGIVRETRRSKPCRRDQGCFSARLAGAVGAARTPLGQAC